MDPGEITQLLEQWSSGDTSALGRLMPLVYDELHRMAKHYMAGQDSDQTLETTAIIHEAYLKLASAPEKNWENRAHFFAVAAKAMRQILVDHARRKHAARRGGEMRTIHLQEELHIADGRSAELVALDDALKTLAQFHPRQSEVVELRYFAGLGVEETAAVLKVSPDTVIRDWRIAKAFLYGEMKNDRTE